VQFLPSAPLSPKSDTTAGGPRASPAPFTPDWEPSQQATPQEQRQQQLQQQELQTVTAAAAAASPLAGAATSTATDDASASSSGSGSSNGSGSSLLQPGGVVAHQPTLERQLSSMAAELLSVQQQAEAPAPLAQSTRERVRK
jgi:hypothetical protein